MDPDASLMPTPELAPTVPEGLSLAERAALWIEMLEASDELLLAGLRREIGPQGDLRAAYRAWYAQWMEEHDRMLMQMAANFARRNAP
jgi:hypothetical protein